MQGLLGTGIGLLLCFLYLLLAKRLNWLPYKSKGCIASDDLLVTALSEWVDQHPEEATEPIKFAEISPGVTKLVTALEIVEGMEQDTEFGRQEYKLLIQLTIDLMSSGKIGGEE